MVMKGCDSIGTQLQSLAFIPSSCHASIVSGDTISVNSGHHAHEIQELTLLIGLGSRLIKRIRMN